MNLKTIAITEDSKSGLDKIKLCPTETYDHLINRLMDGFSGGRK